VTSAAVATDVESAPASGHLVEPRFDVLQLGGVEACGEGAMDRRDQVRLLLPLAALAPQPGAVRPQIGSSSGGRSPARPSIWPRMGSKA
jgi:hypothetical protein